MNSNIHTHVHTHANADAHIQRGGGGVSHPELDKEEGAGGALVEQLPQPPRSLGELVIDLPHIHGLQVGLGRGGVRLADVHKQVLIILQTAQVRGIHTVQGTGRSTLTGILRVRVKDGGLCRVGEGEDSRCQGVGCCRGCRVQSGGVGSIWGMYNAVGGVGYSRRM